MNDHDVKVTKDARVNEVIGLFPATVQVFNDFGIDACCGGSATIEDAAMRDGADPAELLDAVNRVARVAA